jgi:hypothetical protein
LARPPVDHQHRCLHGAGAEPVQGLLAGLKTIGVVRNTSCSERFSDSAVVHCKRIEGG